MAAIVVYAPSTEGDYQTWLDRLPAHTRVRSVKGLEAALGLGRKRNASRICLLIPRDEMDLAELAKKSERFLGWKVVLELPDQSPDSLRIARPLSPRFFTFKSENQDYLVEVVKWIHEHSELLQNNSNLEPNLMSDHNRPRG